MTSLVETVQLQLECLYGIGLQERANEYLISHGDMLNFVTKTAPESIPKELLLVRKPEDDTVEVALYLNESLMENLASNNPLVSINEKNLSDFCILIEGVSHFVYFLWKAQQNFSITQLELELQAEIDKFLMLFCYLRTDTDPRITNQIFEALFDDFKLVNELTEEARERYMTASALASKYCYQLKKKFGASPANMSSLVEEVRKFYTYSHQAKIEYITA